HECPPARVSPSKQRTRGDIRVRNSPVLCNPHQPIIHSIKHLRLLGHQQRVGLPQSIGIHRLLRNAPQRMVNLVMSIKHGHCVDIGRISLSRNALQLLKSPNRPSRKPNREQYGDHSPGNRAPRHDVKQRSSNHATQHDDHRQHVLGE
ncbi:MAG: hypothetical protein M3439_04000, partial [Chloroflexota bacterium]|nr:hypothetical protein [Chloroflexota bacterium]